jgi:cystathionine beta-lyase
MSFDDVINHTGHHTAKWDMMEKATGISPKGGLAMWVADMDFLSPQCIQDAVRAQLDRGYYGYFGDDREYKAAIRWWMQNRQGWSIEPDWIFTTHGLVNALAISLETWTVPGDEVVLMTPVYHAFGRVIRAAGRKVVECQMPLVDGRYVLDIDTWDGQVTPRTKMFVLCSPHNPGGRIWTPDEQRAIADFCRRHDLLLVNDEIHHDLIMPGQSHTPMPIAAPEVTDRLVMLTAPSKTFNMAGLHTGNVIISDPALNKAFCDKIAALGIAPNSMGLHMATAAYSPAGAAWVDEVVRYLDSNRRAFETGVNAIPGVKMMPLQATYLTWVDFSGTGMSTEEVTARVHGQARIATNLGPAFGAGGEGFQRFNIATPRARLDEAIDRLQAAFSDLQ